MATAKTKECIYRNAGRKGDELSLKLHNITEIVKLAAFAAESRRVLEGIENMCAYLPDVKTYVKNSSEGANTWLDMPDATGTVLQYLAKELETINEGFSKTVSDMAQGREGFVDHRRKVAPFAL